MSLPILNFTALQTAVQANRFDASQDMATWVRTAYEQLWQAAEWSFKKVSSTAITLPTTGLPTMPADFSRMGGGGLYDDLGEELEPLEETEFRRRYLESRVAGATGRPTAYTVIDRQIVLGPYPDKAYSGFIAYTRRLCTRDSGGALQVGNFQVGTDLPFWNHTTGEHHYVIALRAMITGRVFESDMSAQMLQEEFQQALTAMMDELTVDEVATREYGADSL